MLLQPKPQEAKVFASFFKKKRLLWQMPSLRLAAVQDASLVQPKL